MDERVTIELCGASVGDGWEPDVDYTLPSDQELAEKIAAEFAAAGVNIPKVAERIAAWKAKYADAKIVIKPIKFSEEDKATAEAIFSPLERALRKRARQADGSRRHRVARLHRLRARPQWLTFSHAGGNVYQPNPSTRPALPKRNESPSAGVSAGARRGSTRSRQAFPVDRCGYLPREVFFGRFGFVGGFFSVWATDFGRFFPAT